MKKLLLLGTFVLLTVSCFAQQGTKNYIGTWKNEKTEFELKADGTTVLSGYPATYSCSNGMMTFDFGGGVVLTYKYTIKGNTLTSSGYGETEVYQRVSGKSSANGSVGHKPSAAGGKEISGQWCKFSNSTNYSYSSQSCFTLNADGTYVYGSESSTSGSNGSTAGQSGDAGTWSYDGVTLRINSQTQGALQYSCSKTYYKKDAALNINGTVYVTALNRGGW